LITSAKKYPAMANFDFQLTFCCTGERSLWIRFVYWGSVASHLKEKALSVRGRSQKYERCDSERPWPKTGLRKTPKLESEKGVKEPQK
jgi:hypothetical protein